MCTNKKLVYHIVLYLVFDKTRTTAAGTRLQNNGDADEKKDVASEHEDKTHSSRHHHRSDSHNRALSLPWLQVLKPQEKIQNSLEIFLTRYIVLLPFFPLLSYHHHHSNVSA